VTIDIIRNESIEDYHGNVATSHSQLRDYAKRGPRYFWMKHREGSVPSEAKKAFDEGQAFEHFLFEPGLFEAEVAVKPEGFDGRTKAGKEWNRANENKLTIDHDAMRSFEWMRGAVESHGTAKAMIDACEQQVTFRGQLPGLTFETQARPDLVSFEGCKETDFEPFTLDLKTTLTLDKLTSGRGVIEFGYHTQVGMFDLHIRNTEDRTEGPLRHYLLAVEKQMPHRAMVIQLSPTFVAKGRFWCQEQLVSLGEHIDSDHWPLTIEDEIVLEPPEWL